MAPSRCAHQLSSHKKLERIQNLVSFTKTATKQQITTKLAEVWATSQCSITDVRILFTLGGDPEALYIEEYGNKVLGDREQAGSICTQCAVKYREFLQFSRQIYNAQFGQHNPNLSKYVRIDKEHRNDRGLIVLSLDGGGMRGLVSIVCMLFASRRILGDESLPLLVDWFVGCSTGSMLALALAKGNSLTDSFYLYWEMKNEIFLDKSTMKRLFGNVVDKQTVRVGNVLNRVFGEETDTFMQCKQRLTVPTLNIATTPGKLHTFRNYPIKGKQPDDVSFKDAARASSAAPTYFQPHVLGEKKFVDGSLVANCPLGILFGEYDKCIQGGDDLKLACIISVGTGEPMETKRRYQSGSSIGHKGRHLRDVAVLLMEQVVGHEKSVVQCAEDRCSASGIDFFRVCPVGIDVRIDQIDDGKLMDMIWETLMHLWQNCDLIDSLGTHLTKLCSPLAMNNGRKMNGYLTRRGHSVDAPARHRSHTTDS